jgi:hypothetical protein
MKLKKGSLEAKRFMAKIRAMKSGAKKKSIGATTYIEQKETKKTIPKKVIKAIRREDGTFKSFKNVRGKIGATKIIEIKETKKTTPKKVLRRIRRADGTFESFVKVKGKISGLHKDTKSHNVRISVISGLNVHYSQKLINLTKDLNKWKLILIDLIEKKKYLSSGMKPVQNMYIKDVRNHIATVKKEIALSKKHIK